jgi:Arc/MetJ family transcription regulator
MMNQEKLFAERIGGEQFGKSTEIYKFEKIKRAKAKARQQHPDLEILDFGVGEPDQVAPAPIREALKTEVDKPENRGYADNGIPEFKEAAADYMKKFFGVELDPASEINHSIGTKPALAMLPLAFVNPGDVIFQTVPGYPVMATHTNYLGGEVVDIPLLEENGFLPDLKSIDPAQADRCKLFYINYPNNPTGAVATDAFYDELIAFAQQHNIHTGLRQRAQIDPAAARHQGMRARTALHEQSLQHDRLAPGLFLRRAVGRRSARHHQGQLRQRAVQGHSARRLRRHCRRSAGRRHPDALRKTAA